ncbi:MAG: hypothetical protein IT373_14115 [Polyangiaceae bacterium]|nr:hypothetical protein [Polyangiaceae bacterium]
MTMREIRFRVREGRLQSVEAVELIEGTEVFGMVNVADVVPATRPPTGAKPKVVLPNWDLGVKEPLTREEIYEDV